MHDNVFNLLCCAIAVSFNINSTHELCTKQTIGNRIFYIGRLASSKIWKHLKAVYGNVCMDIKKFISGLDVLIKDILLSISQERVLFIYRS